MQLSKPIYESLPWAYVLAGGAAIALSHRLHSGAPSTLLLLGGVLGVVGGAVIWLRRRDFRAKRAEYWSREQQAVIDPEDARGGSDER